MAHLAHSATRLLTATSISFQYSTMELLLEQLPWAQLSEVFRELPVRDQAHSREKIQFTDDQTQTLACFCHALVAALQESVAAHKTGDEHAALYDPRQWPGQRDHGEGAWLGFYETLPLGFILLSLLTHDPETFVPRLLGSDRRANWFVDVMLNNCEGGHPQQLADHLQQAFDGNKLKPLTDEVRQVLCDHAATLFRCMAGISGDNDFLEEDDWVPMLQFFFNPIPSRADFM